jgi:hypothetical protein
MARMQLQQYVLLSIRSFFQSGAAAWWLLLRMPVRRNTTDLHGVVALARGKIQGGSSDQRRSFPRIKVLQLAPEL